MSSAVSNIIQNPLSHKQDGSPHSISTLSSSPVCGSNFSPNQATFAQQNCGVSAASVSSSNNNGYQVYGVSPTEGSTASGICSTNNGPMSNVENSLTSNVDIKMKENEYNYNSEESHTQPSTNFSNQDQSSSMPFLNLKESLENESEDDPSRYNNSPYQQQQQQQQQQQISHPQMAMQQISPFDHIKSARKQMYPIDRAYMSRLPYAFNRPNLPYPYPTPDGIPPHAVLNRSPAYHPGMTMIPMMRFIPPHMIHPGLMHPGMLPPGVMPPGTIPPPMLNPQPPPNPPPQQPKTKPRSKKNSNNNNNSQPQQQVPPMMSSIPPPPQMIRPQMDMMRASSSGMMPPEMMMHQNMKMNVGMKQVQRWQEGPKVLNEGMCFTCSLPVTPDNQGVICTALNQGCLAIFHAKCQNISDEALRKLSYIENIEWVCKGCTAKQLIWRADI